MAGVEARGDPGSRWTGGGGRSLWGGGRSLFGSKSSRVVFLETWSLELYFSRSPRTELRMGVSSMGQWTGRGQGGQ